jgi:alanine-glyoxylate transaminase/serine-glyoxylate transaminase/serine-pyruvate transaminase
VSARRGRPFLQIPGPTNVPERVLRAIDRAVIDHRGPEFAALVKAILPDLRRLFHTDEGAVIVYPSSGTGAWEASLVNTLSPGDRVLAFDNGHFSALFARSARNLGLEVDEVPGRWGSPIAPSEVEARLAADRDRRIRAVLAVHNETSTGVRSDIAAIRGAMEAAGHDALLIVDTVSSLGSMDFRFDEWRVDVALTGSQKGLMLPPGLGLVCAGPRALAAAERARLPRNYFDWRPILRDNVAGFYPYTPATNLLYGLREALTMLFEEGLEHVFARHHRLAEAVRAAVRAWELQILCDDARAYSDSLTAVVMPEGQDSEAVIGRARDRFDLALGVGLGSLKGKIFRIGHLGALNELEVAATIAGTEMALAECGVEVELGSGVAAVERAFATVPVPAG